MSLWFGCKQSYFKVPVAHDLICLVSHLANFDGATAACLGPQVWSFKYVGKANILFFKML